MSSVCSVHISHVLVLCPHIVSRDCSSPVVVHLCSSIVDIFKTIHFCNCFL